MEDYFKYTTKSRFDKAINTLIGILEGIAADKTVNAPEWELLINWVQDNQNLIDKHPYNEIIPLVMKALSDGKFDHIEQEDLLWLCNNLRSTSYFDVITSDIQRLQGIISAISSDGVITEIEAESLINWVNEHDHLRSCWPYDELESLLISTLADHWIDPTEHQELLNYFKTFLTPNMTVESPTTSISTVSGICAVTPEILFDGHCFCFTGASSNHTRDELTIMVLDRGGRVIQAVSPRLNYLVVGANGNPCWAYACYGRKIEQAMNLRKQGQKIVIVHEYDFFDAI